MEIFFYKIKKFKCSVGLHSEIPNSRREGLNYIYPILGAKNKLSNMISSQPVPIYISYKITIRVEPLKADLSVSGPGFIQSLRGSQKQFVSYGSKMSRHRACRRQDLLSMRQVTVHTPLTVPYVSYK